MALDFQKINEAAENYRADMAAFLCDDFSSKRKL